MNWTFIAHKLLLSAWPRRHIANRRNTGSRAKAAPMEQSNSEGDP